ncbi:hypothetical protein [Mycolicibacter arupensis]|uniref:Uncharacterized protein n=1 Tax=Mycolicibacter arupensis TaxID=342002 RepID=A0A5C7XYJ4_9MYCO|nr:hypothetical protein [Mycolicibacter arupensis]TXI54470.1 MAG: hypothetical protein E6Q54_14825 [Mycolicibacter arupensis]
MSSMHWAPLDGDRYRAVGERAVYTITHSNEAYWLDARDRYGFTLFDLPVRGKHCPTYPAAQEEAERIDKKRPRVGEMSCV